MIFLLCFPAVVYSFSPKNHSTGPTSTAQGTSNADAASSSSSSSKVGAEPRPHSAIKSTCTEIATQVRDIIVVAVDDAVDADADCWI